MNRNKQQQQRQHFEIENIWLFLMFECIAAKLIVDGVYQRLQNISSSSFSWCKSNTWSETK